MKSLLEKYILINILCTISCVKLDRKVIKMNSNIRSPLARTLHAKLGMDEQLRNMDLKTLYTVRPSLLSLSSSRLFLQLGPDQETSRFVENCFVLSEQTFTLVFQELAKTVLSFFMQQTSINGLLNRGRMFVWSGAQVKELLSQQRREKLPEEGGSCPQKAVDAEEKTPVTLQEEKDEEFFDCQVQIETSPKETTNETKKTASLPWGGKHVLDVGAGDGHVTRIIAEGAASVSATEISNTMMRRLADKGYRVLDAHDWPENDSQMYDIVTCFNLLDRHHSPRRLVTDIASKLSEGGVLVLALVLPFSPYVEYETTSHLPVEQLSLAGYTFEEQVNSLVDDVLPSWGFQVETWSKVPYLCEGDLEQAFYWLDDVIVVARKI